MRIKVSSLMRLLLSIITLAAIIASVACNVNGQRNKKDEKTVSIRKEEGVNPKVKIEVNKKFDDEGNIVSYDSTYSSYYTTQTKNMVSMDSLFGAFEPELLRQYPLRVENRFNELFFNDSLLYHDFFHEDFFQKRFELNQKYIRQVMNEMDSVKNAFFKKHSESIEDKKL